MKGYVCFDCQSYWELEEHDQKQPYCPECGSRNIVGLLEVLEE